MSKRRAEAVAMMNAESNKFRLRAEWAPQTGLPANHSYAG